MTAENRNAQQMLPHLLRAAVGLAARHFETDIDDGVRTTTRDHVLYVLDGHVTAWSRWRDLSTKDSLRFARLLRRRPNQLANADMARRVLDRLLTRGDIPGCTVTEDYADLKNPPIAVDPGMPLADYIDQALSDIDRLHANRRRALPTATSGPHTTTTRIVGPDGRDQRYVAFRYDIQDHHKAAAAALTPIVDAAPLPSAQVPLDALEAIALDLDTKLDGNSTSGHRVKAVRRFRKQIRSRAGQPITELDLAAGGINELLAYTGFGKSVVLIETFACWAAKNDKTIAFVLPTSADVVKASYQIEQALRVLGRSTDVVPLVSPRSLIKVAEQASARVSDKGPSIDWIWERFGYGCALAALASTERTVDTWWPGHEPCAKLRRPRPHKRDETVACPWRTTCGRYRAVRQACSASIIVTSHVNFQLGVLQTPVDDGAGANDQVTVEELLLRRCQIIVIDEVDAFQRAAIDQAGRDLVLDQGGRTNTPLRRFDEDFGAAFGLVQAEVDASVRDAYFSLRYLSENYVSHLTYARLGAATGSRKKRRRRGPGRVWIVPQRWDSWLANQRFGLPAMSTPTDEHMRLLRSVFPNEKPPEPSDPVQHQEVRDHLESVVTSGLGGMAISTARTALLDFFAPAASEEARTLAVNRALRRAILERIRRSLHRLMANTAQLVEIGVESAQAIADALGTYGRWRVTPTGPLGRLVFAFTEYYDDTGVDPARLSTAAFGGDPHTYTVTLGDTTALAHAGTRRIVLGMSATSYFPRAPHSHVHTEPKWWVADDNKGAVTIKATPVRNQAGELMRVSGLDGDRRADALRELATVLWGDLIKELDRLRTEDEDRCRILLATTSYDGARQVAEGLWAAGTSPSRLCLATRPRREGDSDPAVHTGQWWELPADRLEDFPGIDKADVLIAPLARVQRGVNIIGVGDKSALGSVWLIVRPIPLIDEPAELVAHIQAAALTAHPDAAGDPLSLVDERRSTAGTYFEQIVRRPPYFRAQPDDVKLSVVAEIMIGAIQLIGRARRGGTPAVLHLVDGAFLDGTGGTDFASLVQKLSASWTPQQLASMAKYYGDTLKAFLTFANNPGGEQEC